MSTRRDFKVEIEVVAVVVGVAVAVDGLVGT